jgi:hypothetical protein
MKGCIGRGWLLLGWKAGCEGRKLTNYSREGMVRVFAAIGTTCRLLSI